MRPRRSGRSGLRRVDLHPRRAFHRAGSLQPLGRRLPRRTHPRRRIEHALRPLRHARPRRRQGDHAAHHGRCADRRQPGLFARLLPLQPRLRHRLCQQLRDRADLGHGAGQRQSRPQAGLAKFAYKWWIGSGNTVLGLGAGVAYYRVSLDSNALAGVKGATATFSQHDNDDAFAPLLELGVRHAIRPDLRLFADVSGVRKGATTCAGTSTTRRSAWSGSRSRTWAWCCPMA